jgi:hypothetical protein
MASVYGYGPDGLHHSTAPFGHQGNYGQNPNFRQHQYHSSFPGYQTQATFPAPVYQHPVAKAPPAYNPAFNTGYYAPPVASQVPQQQQVPVEAPVSGGLTSVLDYDINIMSKFMTYLAFRISGRKDTDNDHFILSVQSILSAVRLPLSSLILANYFLVKKYEKEPSSFENIDQESIKEILIICLVLANKANDDNNFTNKSWQEATGLHMTMINRLEVEWLVLFRWRLHDVNMQTYNELFSQFNKYSKNISAHEEQKKWEQQLQAQYNQYYQSTTSPVMGSQFSSASISPSERYTPGFSNGYPQSNNWQLQNAYDIQQNSYAKSSRHGHSHSLQSEPDFCTRTGSYQKSKYCLCQYCSTGARQVDWSYNIATAY